MGLRGREGDSRRGRETERPGGRQREVDRNKEATHRERRTDPEKEALPLPLTAERNMGETQARRSTEKDRGACGYKERQMLTIRHIHETGRGRGKEGSHTGNLDSLNLKTLHGSLKTNLPDTQNQKIPPGLFPEAPR